MSETKFTKGDWVSVKHLYRESFEIREVGFDRVHVAQVEKETNAHLIAAAPEMYEALQDIVNLRIDDECTINIEAVKQLLAKARGE